MCCLKKNTFAYRMIEKCYSCHLENLRTFLGDEYDEGAHASWLEALDANKNARCLVTFEIENTSSVKHMMGSLINAASLGRFGIGIGFSSKAMRTFLRHIQYFTFLNLKDKGSYDTANFLALTPEQMDAVLQQE